MVCVPYTHIHTRLATTCDSCIFCTHDMQFSVAAQLFLLPSSFLHSFLNSLGPKSQLNLVVGHTKASSENS